MASPTNYSNLNITPVLNQYKSDNSIFKIKPAENTNDSIFNTKSNLDGLAGKIKPVNQYGSTGVGRVDMGNSYLYQGNIKALGFDNADTARAALAKNPGVDPESIKIDDNGNFHYSMNKSFMQQYGQGIQTGVAVAGLGLNTIGLLDNLKTSKVQREALGQQMELSKEQLRETKAEYERVNRIRKNLSASY